MNDTEEDQVSEDNYAMVEVQLQNRNSDRVAVRRKQFSMEEEANAHDQFKGDYNSSFTESHRTLGSGTMGNEDFNFSQGLRPLGHYDGDSKDRDMRLSAALKINRKDPNSPESLDNNSEENSSDIEGNPEVKQAVELAGENLLPKGEEIVTTMEFLDRILKFEVVLDYAHGVLFCTSFCEILLLGFFFVFSLRRPKQLLFFWAMHVPHLIHAFWGFRLHSKLPCSHDIVELIRPDKGSGHNRPRNLATFETNYKAKIIEYALEWQRSNEGTLKTYTKLTLLCFICDHVDVVLQAIRSRKPGNHYSEMLILGFCFFLQMINLAYPLYALHTVWKFPKEMQTQMMHALFGFTNDMKNLLQDDLLKAKSKLTKENLKYGLRNMAGFIKAKRQTGIAREIELAER